MQIRCQGIRHYLYQTGIHKKAGAECISCHSAGFALLLWLFLPPHGGALFPFHILTAALWQDYTPCSSLPSFPSSLNFCLHLAFNPFCISAPFLLSFSGCSVRHLYVLQLPVCVFPPWCEECVENVPPELGGGVEDLPPGRRLHCGFHGPKEGFRDFLLLHLLPLPRYWITQLLSQIQVHHSWAFGACWFLFCWNAPVLLFSRLDGQSYNPGQSKKARKKDFINHQLLKHLEK